MAAANDLSSCIDPAFLDNPQKPPTLPRVKVSLQRLRAFRPTKIAQPELWAMAESGQIPAHLDRRAQSLEIAEHVLEQGARLGAIEIV
jgi:phospholipase C